MPELTQKKNLLYVVTKLELGGAQKQLLALISGMDTSKFRMFLFTAQSGLLKDEACCIPGLKIKFSPFLERAINPIKDFLALIELCRFINLHHIDIVHTHSSKAGIIGRLAVRFSRAKFIVHTVHGWSFNNFQPGIVRRIYILLERLAARITDKLIVVSAHDKEKGLAAGIGYPDQYELIEYAVGFDGPDNKNPLPKTVFGFNDSNLLVGTISCLKPQKSPRDFIMIAKEVINAVPQSRFLIVGDGILRDDIERMILKYELKEKVILAGWRTDIAKVLASFDVFTLVSLWEGMPISVLEAMAAGKPAVVTDTGGIREVIKNGENGFLVPVHDKKSAAKQIISLLKDASLRQEVGEKARSSIKGRFLIENLVKKTHGLYNNIELNQSC